MSGYEVYGALGSPYSLKVRAAMRAKRLPHLWTSMTADERGPVMANVNAPVIPVIRKPDGSWANDSTPFLLSIEAEGRALLPPTPLARFACRLLEDMADEWFMKAMFHYRWTYAEDQEWCANWLIYDSQPKQNRTSIEAAAAIIRARQISRMPLVGCTPATAPIIEASWRRTCRALNTTMLSGRRFLFGDRPSLACLAFYGQLKVMSCDPTPLAWMRANVPYLYRWLDHADDASGLDGAWLDDDDALYSAGLAELMQIAADTYLPFLAANEAALKLAHETFSCTLEGHAYSQGVFKYQKKCLETLRAEWAGLDATSREKSAAMLGSAAVEILTA